MVKTMKHYLGRDNEFSTTGIDRRGEAIPPWEVTQQLLRQMSAVFESRGLPTWSHGQGWSWGGSGYARDCLRRWGPNGTCYYSDMAHVEGCTAETMFPRTFAAQTLAMIRVVEEARARAQAEAEPGTRYSLSCANVDMLDQGISWGTHMNISVSPSLWNDLVGRQRHPARLAVVASALAAAIPFFGAGYLLPRRKGGVTFSLSGRAHHLRYVSTELTTEPYRRGLLNSRHEPHGSGHERLHLIGFDLAPASSALLASFLQALMAAAEQGYCHLSLYAPVQALRDWSWGLEPATGKHEKRAVLIDGRRLSLSEYMRELTTRLLEMRQSGLITEAAAPQAEDLLPRIIDLTHYLEERALERCARNLDWAAKLLHLTALCDAEGLSLASPSLRLADHDFQNTDPERGPFWAYLDEGTIDSPVTDADIEACLRDGPEESRAWGRGRLIQMFSKEITNVDWSFVHLVPTPGGWSSRVRVEAPVLSSLSQARFEPVLRSGDLFQIERWSRREARSLTHLQPQRKELT